MNLDASLLQTQIALAVNKAKQVKEQEFVRMVSKKVEDAFQTAENRFHSSPSYITNYDPLEEVEFLNNLGIMFVTTEKRTDSKDFNVIFNFQDVSAEPTSEYGKTLQALAISLSNKLMDHFFHPVIAGLESGKTKFVFKHPVPKFILKLLRTPVSYPEFKEIGGEYHLIIGIQ